MLPSWSPRPPWCTCAAVSCVRIQCRNRWLAKCACADHQTINLEAKIVSKARIIDVVTEAVSLESAAELRG